MNVNKEKGKRKTRKCTEQRNRIENASKNWVTVPQKITRAAMMFIIYL